VWIVLLGVVLAAAVFALRSRRRGRVIIGQQFAEAHANERARLAAGPVEPSPMPTERYDIEHGDYNFLSVTPSPLDLKLQELTRRFAASDEAARRRMTAAISLDDQYTLLHFAARCAVLAVREATSSWCEDGLGGMAMIDETRIDWRDAGSPAGLLSYAIAATGAARDALVDRALSLSRPGMRGAIESARTLRSLSDCMYVEVRGDDGGFGLVRKGLERYEPTLDLTRLALRIGTWLEGGRYTAEPVIAEELPAVWFAKAHRQDAEQVARRACACVMVRGTLRKGQVPAPSSQRFIVWVLEMPNERDANLLRSYVGDSSRETFTVGIACGPLFAILVAGSCQVGVASFETQESLSALSEGAGRLLEDTVRV
jgi:hypothetical protein